MAECRTPAEKVSRVVVKDNNSKIGAVALEHIFNAANEAIVSDGYFSIALSGGSIPNILAAGLASCSIKTDFTRWRIVFVDERCVPLDDNDSSYKAFIPLFTELKVPAESLLLIDTVEDVDKSAVSYNERFTRLIPGGSVHMSLLGMGPDGHTASLFPTFVHDVSAEAEAGGTLYMSVHDSPKPPPQRITMTLSTLNKSRQAVFIITGEAKADLLARFLLRVETSASAATKDTFTCRYTEDPEIPASKLCLLSASASDAKITLYLDKAAASKLVIDSCA
jgi:6-phosphogluconolactonase